MQPDVIDKRLAAARLAERRQALSPHDLVRAHLCRWAHVARTKLTSKPLPQSRPRVTPEPWAYFGSFGDDFFDELKAPEVPDPAGV